MYKQHKYILIQVIKDLSEIKSPLDLIFKNLYIEKRLKRMRSNSLPKGGIYELKFGYTQVK